MASISVKFTNGSRLTFTGGLVLWPSSTESAADWSSWLTEIRSVGCVYGLLHGHSYAALSSVSSHTASATTVPQHRKKSLTVVSATSAPPFQPPRHQRNVCYPIVNHVMRLTLSTVNTKHFIMNIFRIESSCPQKKKRTTERCSSVVYTQARLLF
jgi:hypothetical protein